MARNTTPDRPCWLGHSPILLHVGNGEYVEIAPGAPAPDGIDITTLGPEWGTPTAAATSAASTPEEG